MDSEIDDQMQQFNQSDTSPPILVMLAVFSILTVAYLLIKTFVKSMSSVIGTIYIALLILVQFFAFSNGANPNYTGIALSSLACWIPFIILYVAINSKFESWKTPFANSIGYGIAGLLFNPNKLFKECLSDPGDFVPAPEQTMQGGSSSNSTANAEQYDVFKKKFDTVQALRAIHSFPAMILAKTTVSNFEDFWTQLQSLKIIKSTCGFNYGNAATLMQWQRLRYTIAEGIWLILASTLTGLVSMQMVLNNKPAPSMSELEDKNEDRAALAQEYNRINSDPTKMAVAS